LVKWGFDYFDIKNMEIPEYQKYIQMLNQYYKDKKAAADNAVGNKGN